jgi:uncharacterized protein (TIGR04255 family)
MAQQLPNAPLTEVVFEMRWDVVASPNPRISFDPGYPFVFDALTDFARQNGFDRSVDMQSPAYSGLKNSISRRFYRGDDDFPLLQIGPGIFAVNDSSQYDWDSFLRLAEKGAGIIYRNYPKFKEFQFFINHLELRYIDVFEEDLIGSSDFVEFVDRATRMNLELSPFLNKKSAFERDKRMRIQVDADVKGMKDTIFVLELGTAERESTPVIRLESKVITRSERVIQIGSPKMANEKTREWLRKSHDITSPFFKDFIKEEILTKFG